MISGYLQQLICVGLLAFLPAGCQAGPVNQFHAQGEFVAPLTQSGALRLTPEGETLLDKFLEDAELSDLRWSNFAIYRDDAQRFYDGLNGTLAWVRQGKPTPQAEEIIHLLKASEYKGLRPEDYDASRWDSRLAQMKQSPPISEPNLVKFDLALTISTMRYISDLHNGRVNPHLFHFDLDISQTKFSLSDFLRQEILSSPNVGAALERVEPPFPVYRRTEVALKRYHELSERIESDLPPIPHRGVRPGDFYKGVPRLKGLLKLMGDLPAGSSYSDDLYGGDLPRGVKHFQERHGLEPSGVIDEATLRQLNTPLSRRVAQLQFTMERLRWLPHEFDRPPIVVNIPEFWLHADDDEYHWTLSMKVVVGRAYEHQTPVFASEIRAVIFRPYWDVPASIVRTELIPHIERNSRYFAENSYEIVDKKGMVVSDVVNEQIKTQLRLGELRVRQKPGPENALGLVKFDIPSSYDVYMHGTPETELFSRSRRDFSHGCIRVENPVALAEWVLRDRPEWTEESIRNAMQGDRTIQVKLDKPVPVLVLYSTALVTEDGEVRFFEDIYGDDAELERALAERYPNAAGDNPHH